MEKHPGCTVFLFASSSTRRGKEYGLAVAETRNLRSSHLKLLLMGPTARVQRSALTFCNPNCHEQKRSSTAGRRHAAARYIFFHLLANGGWVTYRNYPGSQGSQNHSQSNGEIRGSGKVMWCFIVGGVGLLFWGYVILMVVINVATT